MEYIEAKLSKHYPDVHLVANIIEDFVQNHNRSYSDKKWDGKWRSVWYLSCDWFSSYCVRPLPLLIGVLYKVQERKDRNMQKIGKVLKGKSKHVVPLLGYYWHVLMAADATIRPGTIDVEQEDVKNVLEKNRYEQILGCF